MYEQVSSLLVIRRSASTGNFCGRSASAFLAPIAQICPDGSIRGGRDLSLLRRLPIGARARRPKFGYEARSFVG
jgi:hypothetical protein